MQIKHIHGTANFYLFSDVAVRKSNVANARTTKYERRQMLQSLETFFISAKQYKPKEQRIKCYNKQRPKENNYGKVSVTAAVFHI